MEDHSFASADGLVEEREEIMVPPSGGNPTFRRAHFLKPILAKDHLLPPASLLSSQPAFRKLEKCTLQSYKGLSSMKWKFWVQSLKPRYQDIWKRAGIYEAVLASTYTIPKDKMLIFALAERWCAETNTFRFSWGEVTITLEDIIYLGCFSVLGASFSTPLDNECNDTFNFLQKAYKGIRSGRAGKVSDSSWMEHFISSGDPLEHEAFLALWLSRFVLVCPRNHIAIQDFHVAIHLSRGNRIALAPVVLACIYRDMSLLHNSIFESNKFESLVGLKFMSCHCDLVQMWVWERFLGLRPVPDVVERGEPRSARWNGVTKLKVNDVRKELDSSGVSFVWRPYAIVLSNSILSNLYKDTEQWVVVETDALESLARCLKSSALVGVDFTEQYLPNRVAMQFGLDQDLPSHVVQSNQIPETAWSFYNRPSRGVKLYIPPRLFESDVSSRYVVWWRGLVAINEETVTKNIQNAKKSPMVSCGYEKAVKSLATSDCVEKEPKDYIAETVLTRAQVMSQSRKTGSSGKRTDLNNDSVLNSYDDIEEEEEDSLTVEQLLNLSRKTESFEKATDDKLVLNTVTPRLLNCTSEPVELSVQIMSSPDKREKSKSLTKEQIEPKECAAVSRNLKFINVQGEMSVHGRSSSDNHKQSDFSTERQTELGEDAARSPEENIVNLEEEICEDTTSNLQHLGLKARIWRLETIVDKIKAAKNGASSRGNAEK